MGSEGALVVFALPLVGHEIARVEDERRLGTAGLGVVEAALEEGIVTVGPARVDTGGPGSTQDRAPALGRFGDEPRKQGTVEERIARLERDAQSDESLVAQLLDGDHIRRQMRLVAIQRAEALRMRMFLDRARTRLPRPLIEL